MSYNQYNYQESSDDDINDKGYGYQNRGINSTRNSSSPSNSSESDFNEDSSSDSNDSADEEFDLKPSRKQAKKTKQTTAKQTNQRSSSKKGLKESNSYEFKKSRKSYEDSDSTTSEDFDQYSESFDEGGIANREGRSRRNTSNFNYNESEEDDDQDEFSEEFEVNEEPKEEYTGPIIERVIGTEITKTGEKRRYYCKYKGKAYIHCEWLTRVEVDQVHNGANALKKWKKDKKKNYGIMEGAEESVNNLQIIKSASDHSDDIINPEYYEVFRVIAYDNEKDEYLVQWSASNQQEDEFTWESKGDIDSASLLAFEKREEKYDEVRSTPPPNHNVIQRPENYFDYSKELHNVPHFKDGLELRDYQLEGINKLRNCWYNHKSFILADEMGLGKTVQGVCMVNVLFQELGFRGPYLVIAPKSTLMQWEREFHNWTNLNVVRYSDGKKAREIIRKYELYWTKPDGTNDENFEKFEVMLMNYEKLDIEDVQEIVNKFTWEYAIVDEAHRLKNRSTKKYLFIEGLLKSGIIKSILLMTGTPMQNSPSEIWGLLHLIDPATFDDFEGFEKEFGNNENTEKLHQIIDPYMIRRVKKQVEKTIGTKEENIIEVELSKSQRNLYRQALENNASQSNGFSFSTNNVKMQLRKICNHPYLLQDVKRSIDSLIDETEKFPDGLKQLIHCCGKMLFVDKLLTTLRQDKSNKVLIFSQMTQILDLFQDYCTLRDYKYERIDGQVKGNKRQQAMDRFNDPKYDTFIFLLCTKAGGQGLNLTAATYVIIYDSDWNPQNDIQAQARCHRIGQKNKVEVFRLVSRGTYETKMLKESLNKMRADQALDNTQEDNKQEDIRYIVRFDLDSYDNTSIEQLFENKITIHNHEELDKILESETQNGDIDDKEFMAQLRQETEFLDSRTRRRTRTRYASDEDIFEDEDDFPSDFKFQKVEMALLHFGWGKWEKIKQQAFQDTKSTTEIVNYCTIVLYAMLYPTKDRIDNFSAFREITGFDSIDQNQQQLVKKLLRNNKLQRELTKHRDKHEKRIFELKMFNDFFDNNQIPITDIPQNNFDWQMVYDWDIITFIQEDGWDNWGKITKDISSKHENLFKDHPPEEAKKFLKKRFHDIFANVKNQNGEKDRHHHHHGDGSHSKRESRHRDHDKKRVQKQQNEDPRIIRLKLLSRALCLFGRPVTEKQWSSYEHYCSCDDNSHREDVPRIIDAAHKLLDSKNRDPDFVFEESDQKEFRYFMTEKLADEIAISCQWFHKFHEFYPFEFEENRNKLSSIDPHPDWWKHSEYDPILFRHIDLYGFSRPYSLIAQPPFADLIPNALDDVYLLADGEEKNDHHRFDPPNVSPLEIIANKHKLMTHIDLIINDIRNEKLPLINLKINFSETKFELPKIIKSCYLESIGDGDFRAIDGYLYRQGFSSRVKYNNNEYNCSIDNTSYMPFRVQDSRTGREYIGKTPLEAWNQALGREIDTDAYILFGIGIPSVRYWLQNQLGDKRVSGYRPIQFEVIKQESKKSSLFNSSASSMQPPRTLGIKKKKLFSFGMLKP